MVDSSVILEDPLIEVSFAIIWILLGVVHYHVRLLLSNHLHSLVELWRRRHIVVELATRVSVLGSIAANIAFFSFLLHLVPSFSHFLLTLNGWPIDSITNGLSTTAEDRERIEPWIGSEDLFPVLTPSYIINALEWFPKLVKVFNCCLVFTCKHDVEFKESGHEANNDEVENERYQNEYVFSKVFVVAADNFVVEAPLYGLVEVICSKE